MNDDLKTRIKELKEELELLEKATDAEDKTLFTITAKIASQSDKGSYIVIGADYNKQMALLCYLAGIKVSEAHKGIEKLVSGLSNDFVQMMLEHAENVKSTIIEEDE
jgi:hypothetical protein